MLTIFLNREYVFYSQTFPTFGQPPKVRNEDVDNTSKGTQKPLIHTLGSNTLNGREFLTMAQNNRDEVASNLAHLMQGQVFPQVYCFLSCIRGSTENNLSQFVFLLVRDGESIWSPTSLSSLLVAAKCFFRHLRVTQRSGKPNLRFSR